MALNKIILTCTALFVLIGASATAQNKSDDGQTGLPGDQFSLEGALSLFKKSPTVEDFEKALNTESSFVNNLDMNDDGSIDYIRVIDKADKDAHVLILQAIVSEMESQDIAVIELEKTGEESAMVQIIGDEDIYGEKIIIEPEQELADQGMIFDWGSGNPMAGGPNPMIGDAASQVFVNVWGWPSVRVIFTPGCRPWASPWRWRQHPVWWRPWRPMGWTVWNPGRAVHRRSFVVVTNHRVIRAHRIYTPYRTSSVIVRARYAGPVKQYRVTAPRGNKVIIRETPRNNPRGRRVKVRRF